jgi:hypothetical protein
MARRESIDVGWVKIDAAPGIARELAAIDVQRAEPMPDATAAVKGIPYDSGTLHFTGLGLGLAMSPPGMPAIARESTAPYCERK